MKLEISDKEKLMLISCLNSRLSEYKDDDQFDSLLKMDYADWAENTGSKTLTQSIKYIDTVNRLLIKLGNKKKATIFENIVSLIKDIKKCKHSILIGQIDDYYELWMVAADYKVIMIDLKTNVTLRGEFGIHWIQRDKTWIASEASKNLTSYLTKKEAWIAIKNCNYKGSGLNDKMLRFLKVIMT